MKHAFALFEREDTKYSFSFFYFPYFSVTPFPFMEIFNS
jgi:hypothetical protein